MEHIARHVVAPDEAEHALNHVQRPYPHYLGNGKFIAAGQTESGRYIQVVYTFDSEDVVFVIHARPLRDHEKRRFRRRTRGKR